MRRTVFTVTFEEPFWVGVIERWDGSKLLVGRHVFGAEPSNAELTRFLLDGLAEVPLAELPGATAPKDLAKSPKRREREARRELAKGPSVSRDTYKRLLAQEGRKRAAEDRGSKKLERRKSGHHGK